MRNELRKEEQDYEMKTEGRKSRHGEVEEIAKGRIREEEERAKEERKKGQKRKK